MSQSAITFSPIEEILKGSAVSNQTLKIPESSSHLNFLGSHHKASSPRYAERFILTGCPGGCITSTPNAVDLDTNEFLETLKALEGLGGAAAFEKLLQWPLTVEPSSQITDGSQDQNPSADDFVVEIDGSHAGVYFKLNFDFSDFVNGSVVAHGLGNGEIGVGEGSFQWDVTASKLKTATVMRVGIKEDYIFLEWYKEQEKIAFWVGANTLGGIFRGKGWVHWQ